MSGRRARRTARWPGPAAPVVPIAALAGILLAYRGGAPAGAQCALEQALRVTIIVS